MGVAVVWLLQCDATLQGFVRKMQHATRNYDPVILTDEQGNTILESEGTTGG